jgi:hypothetical protein
MPGDEALPVTYPTTPLAIKVRIALGADLSADPLTWAWQDITDKVRFDLGISLETGRRENSGSVTTARGVLKLDNRDGRFSRRNPTGPYCGLLSKNTPIWVTVDAGPGEKTRMEMFVNEWPVRWSDKSATDSTVTIQCAGVLRRLAQGQRSRSAVRRSLLGDHPVEYWPLEDGADSAAAGSAVGGVSLFNTGGTVTFASVDDVIGTLPDFSAGGTLANKAALRTTSSTVWTVELVSKAAVGATSQTPLRWLIDSGSYNRYRYFPDPVNGTIDVFAFTPAGALDNPLTASVSINDGGFHHVRIVAQQNGTGIDYQLWFDGVLVDTGTTASVTLGRISGVQVSPDQEPEIQSVGHIALYDSALTSTRALIADAYAGEMAHVRLARVCAEEGILFDTLASTSATMGAQGFDSLPGILRAAESAGGGVLYERRWGLSYQSLAERYNAAVALALDLNQGHIAELPEPADDDQRTRNLWTASRPDGSEYTAEQTTGPMGTGAQGPGTYDDSLEVNVEDDDQLDDQAGWRLHLGTVDEDRWPRLDLNFTRNPSLIASWTALAYGARVTVANPLPQMPPDPLDLVIEGHAERFDTKIWTATLNASPASPYRVLVLDSTSGNLGRLDTGTSTLAADATSSDVTISVASTSGVWTTGAVSFDILVAGERMSVTNISGATSPQTFTVTRAVNGVTKAQPAIVGGFATRVSLWQPAVIAL